MALALKKPMFSVVIPCLNEEECLPHLLSDLQAQTYSHFEVIVVDAESEDATVAQAKKWKSVKVVQSKKRNVSFQRNLGATSAKGEYLLFLDADTRIPPYFLEGLHFRLSSNPADVFTTWMSTEGLSNSEKSLILLINFVVESSFLLDIPSVFGAMIGVKKAVFAAVAGFDESVTFAEDGELLARLKNSGAKFVVYRDPRFWFSLRRFKKEGTIPMFQKSARLHLKIFLSGYPRDEQDLYPMLGGEYYADEGGKTRSRRFLQNLGQKVKQIREKADISHILNRFFEE